MLRSVALKTLFDQRRALVAWGASLALLVAMYAAIWPSVRGQPSMSDFLNQMPEAMRSLFTATGADMSTPVGYVKVELLSIMGPLLLIAYAITAGAHAIAGEEDRHTLDLLLANPISRTRIVWEAMGALAVGTALLGAVTAGALIGEGQLAGLSLPVGGVAAAMVHLTLLAVVFGTLALAIGAGTGSPALSRAVPAVVAVVAYVVNGLAPVVSWLGPVQPLSPFYQYSGSDPLQNGLSVPANIVALATIVGLAVFAVEAFRRRDVAA